MTDILSNLRRALPGLPQRFKHAALFVGGAAAAGVLSVSASYGVVSTLFSRTAAPASPATTTAMSLNMPARLAPVPAVEPLTLASASAGIDISPLEAPAEPRIALIVPARPASVAPVKTPQPEPAAPIVASIASRPSPAPALAPAAPGDNAERMAPARLAARAPQALTSQAASETPSPLPNGTVVASLRPAPRPDAPMLQPAVLLVEDASDAMGRDIPGLRPQPRPASLRMAAIAAPQASPAPAQIIETGFSQPQPSGGLFAPSRSGASGCNRSLTRAMPRRPAGAPGGNAFISALGNLSGPERDAKIINELARGNIPAFLRQLKPVAFRGKDANGKATEIVICVTPDYLALGSDRDYVRVPLGLPAAASIAGRFKMTLPTPRMVDAIYAQADVHLSPAPMQAGPQMSSTAYLLRHNATIQAQLKGRRGLVAGQKKDVVMASRMASAPGRVAIYGWHRSGGRPIQPVSTVHGKNYADYSHGIRLVSRTAFLNGRAVDIDELLSSPRYAGLLNTGGPLPGRVIRIASR